MLDERQKKVVIDKVNKDFNIPLISEASEENFIKRVVDKVVPEMETSLAAMIPTAYVELIKIAFNDELLPNQKKESISEILRNELSGPFAKELNKRVDMSFVPESIEGKVLNVVTDKLVDEFVESAGVKHAG